MREPKPGDQPKPLGLPDDETLLGFIKQARSLDVSDIAKRFGLKGNDRRLLRQRLKALAEAGALERPGRKTFQPLASLPETGVCMVCLRDDDGDLWVQWGQPAQNERAHKRAKPVTAPLARLAPSPRHNLIPPDVGDRLFVRFERQDEEWIAYLIKKLDQNTKKLVGVVRVVGQERRFESVDRKDRERYSFTQSDLKALNHGDVVTVAEVGGAHRYGPKAVRVIEVIGHEDNPKSASIMAVAANGIRMGFDPQSEREAVAATLPALGKRLDLRALGLVTIDPPDARDHDDAVFAEPDSHPDNVGGWIVWVAIADVAYYVRAQSALDRDARSKGNSTYFPDRVEPMLPHALSSNLCSLRVDEDRAALVVRMVFNAKGVKLRHQFSRALIRSKAKLTYQQAQDAKDGQFDEVTTSLWEPILKPLWSAHECLKRGRDVRGPLEINAPERRVWLNEDGTVRAIEPRESLEAHQLIEEMMIQANVCAAETLEAHKTSLVFRVHEPPSMEKLNNLSDFLQTIQKSWSRGEPPRTERFNALLREVKDTEQAAIVNEVVLRTQMQAHYSPDNLGHFGLNLDRYAHFTSPIRRYADLIVHRGLIRALNLGDDGLSDFEIKTLGDLADHITACERRSMAAEREAIERYVAAFLFNRVGGAFWGRIVGVTRFGLFVKLEDTGADGIIPITTLGDEYFIHDDVSHALVGERSNLRWRLGARIEVRLKEAAPLTGGLLFEAISAPEKGDPNAPKARLGVRRRLGDGARKGPKSGPASYGKNQKSKKKR